MSNTSASRVTITLALNGQKATVTGLEGTTAALEEMSEAAKAMSDSVEASLADVGAASELAAEATTTSLGDMAAAAELAAETVASSQEQMVKAVEAGQASIQKSTEAAAVTSTTAADEIVAANTKVSQSSEDTAKRVTTASASSNKGILAQLTSLKTLAVVGVAVSSVKSFSGYETALTRLSTLAGLTQKQLSGVNTEIMKMAPGLGQTPTALANAMYSPVSEGFGVKASEQVASQAAVLSNLSGAPISGTGSSSYAISTMLQTLGMKPTQKNINSVTGLIRGAVGAGDMQMSDFLGAASTGVFNTGKTYGISAQDTVGALDYFTSQGVPPQEAATRLRMTTSLLTGQSASAAKYGQALGLDVTNTSTNQLSQQLTSLGLNPTKLTNVLDKPGASGGYSGAFDMLNKAMAGLPHDQQVALWSKLFGGGRSDSTAMALAQGASSGLLPAFTSRSASLATPQATAAAEAQYQQTPAYFFKNLESEVSKAADAIGKDFMPGIKALGTILEPFLKFAASGVGSNLIALGLGVAGAKAAFSIGSKLLGAFDTAIATDTAAAYKQAAAEDVAGGAGVAEGAGGLGAKGLGAASAGLGGGLLLYQGYKGKKNTAMSATEMIGGGALAGAAIGSVVPVLGTAAGAVAGAGVGGVLDLLHIGFASGGVMGAGSSGYTANRPTAIVGEGNPAHPEFVIPTDPSYRTRALGLYSALGSHLMASGGVVANPQTANMGAWDSYLMSNPYKASPTASASSGVGAQAVGGSSTGGGSPSANQALGKTMAAALGWTGSEWTALLALWTKESGWSNTAKNPTSGAYGIAQALGHGPSNQYPAGAANPPPFGTSSAKAQIQWGLGYIQGRYGDPLGAEAHEQQVNWYAKGGVIPHVKPLLFDSGGMLPEGTSVLSNQTGSPEPLQRVGAGGAAGTSGDLTVNLVMDGKTMTTQVIKNFRAMAARL